LSDSFENSMLLFNEVMVTVYLYVLISLTDYNDDADLFENCGIALLTVVLFSFAINFIKFLYFIVREIYLKIKKRCGEKSSSTVVIKPG
jgi:Kef-type K+ transport system membrane component KefB